MEVTVGGSLVATGVKSGALTALVAMITTDQDMVMVLTVGVIGGFAYIGKEFTLEAFREDFFGTLLNLPFSILMAISLTGVVFYGGKDGFNQHVQDMGVFFWIFLAFMASMNYRRVMFFLTDITAKLATKVIDKWQK